jgi:hypothetical protein
LGTVVVSMMFASAAHAQTVVATAPQEHVVSTGPSSLFMSGLLTLGIPYGTSVIVAAGSSRAEDKNLYVPVAGPWLDFATRADCGSAGQPACSSETAYKVLLAADGILQAVGAIEIVSALLMPPVQTVASDEPRVMVGPSRVGSAGYGLAAIGAF